MSARVAIVTGAARGIGRAVAERLAADGCDVALVDRVASDCADTASAVGSIGRRVTCVGGDVSDETAVAEMVDAVVAELGPPTVLVNNAGVLREGLAARTSLEEWQLPIDVNLTGTFLMSRAVVGHMREAGRGRIVNLSSIGARGLVGLAAYGASKAGVEALTRTLAIEHGRHGITVNAVAPGFVVTAMNEELAERSGRTFDDLEAEMLRDVPVGRSGTPDDIAHAVAFFVDPRTDYVSGQVLTVAGGPGPR